MNPLALVIVTAQFAAAVALLNGILTTIGQSRIAIAAIESIARQPEAKSSIMTALFVSLGMAETSGIYGFVIALVLTLLNPFLSTWGYELAEMARMMIQTY